MIIVTGAAGLIGSAVVRELNRQGRTDLLLVDHLGTSDKWMNLRSLRYVEYLEKTDFQMRMIRARDDGWKTARIPPADTIIHLGACSSTTERDASYLIENNYQYSALLNDVSLRYRMRFVYASSAATYGDGALGYEDDVNALHSLRPLNAYGYSKHMFDLHLAQSGFHNAAGIKYFNIFGPNEYHKGDMMSVVLKGFRQIKETGTLNLFKSYRADYPDGGQKRDFLYVEDAAKMTVYLALDNVKARGLFNFGSGHARTWLELVTPIFEAMGKPAKIEFVEMPEHLRDRYQYYTCAPMKRLIGSGYTRQASGLRDAVVDYVQNYLMKDEARA